MGNNLPYYERDGKRYERFTTVLDYFTEPGLLKAMMRDKEAFSEASRSALAVGSRVDELCEIDWRDGGYKLKKSEKPEVVNCMTAWERWKREWPQAFLGIRAMQEKVFYDDWMVAGTLDIRQEDGITDIKTSKAIRPRYRIQVAGYNRKHRLPYRRVLRLDKQTAEYEYSECPYEQGYLENLFVGLLVNYRFHNQGEL